MNRLRKQCIPLVSVAFPSSLSARDIDRVEEQHGYAEQSHLRVEAFGGWNSIERMHELGKSPSGRNEKKQDFSKATLCIEPDLSGESLIVTFEELFMALFFGLHIDFTHLVKSRINRRLGQVGVRALRGKA